MIEECPFGLISRRKFDCDCHTLKKRNLSDACLRIVQIQEENDPFKAQ